MTKITIYPEPEYVILDATTKSGRKYTKRLLTKEYIQRTYIDMELSRIEMYEKCNVSEKVFSNSYHYWFTKDERRLIGNQKIAKAQRTKNSNSYNTGTLRVVLDKRLLVSMIKKHYAVGRMGVELGVASQTVKANLEHYGLADNLVKHGVPYELALSAKSLDKYAGTKIYQGLVQSYVDLDSTETKTALDDLISAEQILFQLRQDVSKLRNRLLGRMRQRGLPIKAYKLPGSNLNARIKGMLLEAGYDVYCEYQIANRFYDFKFRGYKLLLEVDTDMYHSNPERVANDKVKTQLAKDNGFKLLRVIVGKDTKLQIQKKILACIEPLKLKKLHP